MNELIPSYKVESRIHEIREQRVMLDRDLAELYGVTTKRLNQQVNRNRHRFPMDFMFELTPTEKAEVVAKCNHLRMLKYSAVLPKAFTEHGAVMLACVLNSPTAVEASILVVRAFNRSKEILGRHRELARRLDALERRLIRQDHRSRRHSRQIRAVFDAVQALIQGSDERTIARVGFKP